ncbi:circadian-associated transcriptional repressor [Patagioenas fasciata]|uniref:circadian-associated transcriptional repressor n=1 Tax=Patagioenas fasciata TaxID=372321 RepID=UPI0032E8B62D
MGGGGAGRSGRHVRPHTCPRGAAAAGAEPGPESGTGTGTPGQRHRDSDTGAGTGTGTRTGTRTATETPAQSHRHRHGDTGSAAAGSRPGGTAGAEPMESRPRACSCGSRSPPSPGGPSRSPPRAPRTRKRPGGPDGAPPDSPPSPRAGKRPRKGDGRDAPPSDADRLFAQKCRELRGFIRPLAELLEGLKRGRYDRGLSSFQQSVAMDRLQRIIGVLQNPEMGARCLGTLLQVEPMLRGWFPHVTPQKAPQEPPPPPAAPPLPPRRRPPAGPPGAPRCRHPPGDTAAPAGGHSRCHRPGAPAAPPAPDA